MNHCDVVVNEAVVESSTAGGTRAAWIGTRGTGLLRGVVSLLVFVLMCVVVVPARGQCPAGWLPGHGAPGVNDMALFSVELPDGDLVVGGYFTVAGGVRVNNIARYNPATGRWFALGSGTDDAVRAIAVMPDGDIVVGGDFARAGGMPAPYIARYSFRTNTWSRLTTGLDNLVFTIVALPDGDIVVGGLFSTTFSTRANGIARYSFSTSTWSALGQGVTNAPNSSGRVRRITRAADGSLIVGGTFVNAGSQRANNIARYDLRTGEWSPLGSGLMTGSAFFDAVMQAIELPDGDIVAVGNFTANSTPARMNVARYDSTTNAWSFLSGYQDNATNSVALLEDGDIIIVGSFSWIGNVVYPGFARYDFETQTWSRPSHLNLPAYHVTRLSTGNILICGDHSTQQNHSYVTEYDFSTSTWSEYGHGLTGQVFSLFTLPDGDVLTRLTNSSGMYRYDVRAAILSPFDGFTNGLSIGRMISAPNGDIIASGNFTSLFGPSAPNFARYSFSTLTWSPLGGRLSISTISGMTVLPNGDVLVCGNIGPLGGPTIQQVAHYSSSTNAWTFIGAMGNLSGGSINAVAALPDGNIIVGGRFDNFAGVFAVNNIVRYSFTTRTWTPLGTGTNGAVLALAVVPGGDLFVGGSFTTAGALSVNGFVKYKPGVNAWTSAGLGASGIDIIKVLPDGNLVLAGTFTTAGGVAARRIAKFDVSNNGYSALGTGLGSSTSAAGYITAVEPLPSGDILIGGDFDGAGGLLSRHIARYTFGQPPFIITTQPQSQTACVESSVTLCVEHLSTAPCTYQWQWRPAGSNGPWANLTNGVTVDEDSLPVFRASLVGYPTVQIRPVTEYMSFGPLSFRCVVTNTCGSVTTSNAATITAEDCSPCIGDYNLDGGVDGQDIEPFFADWEAGLPQADVNQDGGITVGDVEFFFRAWEVGC